MIKAAILWAWEWALARSKNSVTHLLANVAAFLSVAFEAFWMIVGILDPEIIQMIVGTIGDPKLAGMVSLVLSLLFKMARDRRWNPFSGAEPHEEVQ